MKKFVALALSVFMIAGPALADTPNDADPKPAAPAKPKAAAKTSEPKDSAAIAAELEQLRQALQSQQEQIQELREELAKRDHQINEARDAAASANSRAVEAGVKATEAVNTSAEVKSSSAALASTVGDLKASNEAVKTTVATAQADAKKSSEEGPATIRYKGINITPGGFIAAETVYRTRSQAADINTQFNGIPYPGNSQSKVSEFNFSGRQTRATLLAETKVGSAKITGYYEGDFLGAGTTSNNRQSNSYVFRQRQVFAQAAFDNGFSITGGQMWSLATENRKSIQNRQEALPMQIDPQYVVGFTWQRAYGLRLVQSFADKFSLGVSIEGPQTTVGGRGFSAYTNTSATGVVTTYQNFWQFAPGNGGGLYNAFDTTGYSPNKAPDFIFKAALDPGWGHYEIFGIISEFRNRIYPCAVVGTNATDTPAPATVVALACSNGTTTPSAFGAHNDSRTGGGFGASFTVPIIPKKLDFGIKAVGGDGIGRYGSAQLADATVRPDGTLALIRTEHALAKLEFHATPKLDIYAYFGNEYAWRAAYTGYQSVKITNTPAIPATATQPAYPATHSTSISLTGIGGYGSPLANNTGCSTETDPTGTSAPGAGGTCAGDTRNIVEGTLGFWHKFFQGPKGRMQWGIQYSYIERWGWSGNNNTTTSVSPKAVDNMVFTSFRYYLP